VILISPALARGYPQTSDQNQLIFSHVVFSLSYRGTIAFDLEALKKGFPGWLVIFLCPNRTGWLIVASPVHIPKSQPSNVAL
jgi:hypothetical protein